MRRRSHCKLLVFSVLSLLFLGPAYAPAQTSGRIDWKRGPLTAQLGNIAQVMVPEGYRFTGAAGTEKFQELNHNPPDSNDLGTIIPPVAESASEDDFWFILFTFRDIGYVSDDEKNNLDPDAILKSIREGTEAANAIRKEKGGILFKLRIGLSRHITMSVPTV